MYVMSVLLCLTLLSTFTICKAIPKASKPPGPPPGITSGDQNNNAFPSDDDQPVKAPPAPKPKEDPVLSSGESNGSVTESLTTPQSPRQQQVLSPLDRVKANLDAIEAEQSTNFMRFSAFRDNYKSMLTGKQRVYLHEIKRANNKIIDELNKARSDRQKQGSIGRWQQAKLHMREDSTYRQTSMVSMKIWWMLRHAKKVEEPKSALKTAENGAPLPEINEKAQQKIDHDTKTYLDYYADMKKTVQGLNGELDTLKNTITVWNGEKRSTLISLLKKASQNGAETRDKKKARSNEEDMDEGIKKKCEQAEAKLFLDLRMLWMNCQDVLKENKDNMTDQQVKDIPQIKGGIMQ